MIAPQATGDRYFWEDWEQEDEDRQDDPWYLRINYPDGEEMAVIIHRTGYGAFPLSGSVAQAKERAAQAICDALNNVHIEEVVA